MKTIKFSVKNQNMAVTISHGHVWLELASGVSAPLAMSHDEEGGRYAYLVSGVGTEAHEVRIYDNGEVYGAD